MPRQLLCTVGTSLLTNRDRPWTGWSLQRKDPLPDPTVADAWLASADPITASAETNTLCAVGLGVDDRVRLLHSDTPEGRYCSQRLLTYLRAGRCREADERKLSALSYNQGSFAQRGLRSLVDEAITAIRQAHDAGLEPVLCATGGFKAEIAFLNLLGALLRVEVCYIHEQFREVVRLPRLPLTWDAAFVLQHSDFFEWIDTEPRASTDVESWLRGRPELRPLVDDDPDGHTYLNAAGNLLFNVSREELALGPRAVWPPAASQSPAEKKGLSGVEHHRPRGWEKFVDRLAAIDCVKRIVYDPAARAGSRARVLDSTEGKIAVRYESGDGTLPLAVLTTARGEAQTELVADYLRRLR
ncbi:MAG TPA: putative CRISPR-associated protein [Gemmataceae bacterium]|jgi:putative CRISPR-associated protein (TIGR02619 family)